MTYAIRKETLSMNNGEIRITLKNSAFNSYCIILSWYIIEHITTTISDFENIIDSVTMTILISKMTRKRIFLLLRISFVYSSLGNSFVKLLIKDEFKFLENFNISVIWDTENMKRFFIVKVILKTNSLWNFDNVKIKCLNIRETADF